MFNKIKLKLKNKLRNWLEIDNLEKDLDDLNDYTRIKLYQQNNEINYNSDSIKMLHNTIENVVHIGTDARPNGYGNSRGHSWAVVCVEGKMNMVKFVPLDGGNSREILHFLKQFEGGRHCIDAPCKEMFYDGLFKFGK